MSTADLRQQQPRSLEDLTRHVGAMTRLGRTVRGQIAPADDRVSDPARLKPVPFDNASFIGARTIWYLAARVDGDNQLRRVDQRPEDERARRLYGEYLDLLSEISRRVEERAR